MQTTGWPSLMGDPFPNEGVTGEFFAGQCQCYLAISFCHTAGYGRRAR